MTPIGKLHTKIKEEIEQVRDETGAFVSSITIAWGDGDNGRIVTEISCFMGTSTKFEPEKKEDD
jgi:hypothetical protein